MLEQAFQRYRSTGDAVALGEVFRGLAPGLLAAATRRCPAGLLAEDVVQATFLRAIEIRRRYDPTRPLRHWMLGILTNVIHEERRRGRERPVAVEDVAAGDGARPESVALRNELGAELHRALQALPPAYRRALEMRLLECRTLDDIAGALGCPVGTVKARLHRGTAMLRRAMPRGLAGVLVALALGSRAIAGARASGTAAVGAGATLARLVAVPLCLVGVCLAAWTWADTPVVPVHDGAAAARPGDATGVPPVAGAPRSAVAALFEVRGALVPHPDPRLRAATVLASAGGQEVGRAGLDADLGFALWSARRAPRLSLDHPFFELVGAPRAAPADGEAPLEVYRGGHVEGQIAGWVPRDGARLEVFTEPDPLLAARDPLAAMAQAEARGVQTAPITAGGRFEVQAVFPSPKVSVRVRSSGTLFACAPFRIAAGESRRVELRAVPERDVFLSVLDAAGRPAGEVAIELLPADAIGDLNIEHLVRRVDTGAGGTCALAGLPRDAAVACSVRRRGHGGVALVDTILEAGVTGRTIRLPRGAVLAGIVRDAAGGPVVGARVALIAARDAGPALRGPALAMARDSALRTDARGGFRLGGVPPVDLHVAVVHPDFAPHVGPVPDGGDGLAITLERPVVLRARLRGTLPDRVTVLRRRGLLFTGEELLEAVHPDTPELVIGALPAGRLVLQIGVRLTREVRACAGATLDLGDIDVPAPLVRTGTVRDARGAPVAFARVLPVGGSRGGGAAVRPVRSDRAGRFATTAPGPLVVQGDGFAPRRVDGDGVIDVVLSRGGRLEGVVLLAPADRPDAIDVVVAAGEERELIVVTQLAPDGTFAADGVPPGRCEVRAIDAAALRGLERRMAMRRFGGAAARWQDEIQRWMHVARADVRDGATTRVILDVRGKGQGTATVGGTVTDGGRPVGFSLVSVRGAGEAEWMGGVEDGRLELPDLPAGVYELRLMDPSSRAPCGAVKRLEVPVGGRGVEVRWEVRGTGG